MQFIAVTANYLLKMNTIRLISESTVSIVESKIVSNFILIRNLRICEHINPAVQKLLLLVSKVLICNENASQLEYNLQHGIESVQVFKGLTTVSFSHRWHISALFCNVLLRMFMIAWQDKRKQLTGTMDLPLHLSIDSSEEFSSTQSSW